MRKSFVEWALKKELGGFSVDLDIAGMGVMTPDGPGSVAKIRTGVSPKPGFMFVTLASDTGQDHAKTYPISALKFSDANFGGGGIFKSPDDPIFGGAFKQFESKLRHEQTAEITPRDVQKTLKDSGFVLKEVHPADPSVGDTSTQEVWALEQGRAIEVWIEDSGDWSIHNVNEGFFIADQRSHRSFDMNLGLSDALLDMAVDNMDRPGYALKGELGREAEDFFAKEQGR